MVGARTDPLWNIGSWFGGQLGGTLWLGLLGVALCFSDVLAGVAALAAFAFLNALGWWLWSRREIANAYISLQVFLAACAVTTALFVLFFRTRPAALAYGGPPLAILLIFPGVMLVAYLRRPRP